MKNENKEDDMVEIMSYLHQYVPCIKNTKDVHVQANGEVVSVSQATFFLEEMTLQQQELVGLKMLLSTW